MQKQKKSHASIFHKTWKPHFGPISGPFDPKTLKNKIFPKKIICCNFQKNNEKKNYISWFFAKLGKLHFGSFWTRTRFSSKNLAPSLFKLDETLTSSKKKIIWAVPSRNSGQTDKAIYRWNFIDLKLVSLINQFQENNARN